VVTAPTKTESRGLIFSPPILEHNSYDRLSSLRRISTLQTSEKKSPAIDDERAQEVPPARTKKSRLPSDNESDEHRDFDSLLTDDVLSDSDSKNNSAFFGSTTQKEDLIF
jgi:hypothetical protein